LIDATAKSTSLFGVETFAKDAFFGGIFAGGPYLDGVHPFGIWIAPKVMRGIQNVTLPKGESSREGALFLGVRINSCG
jgi:hypothetical protein